MHTYTLIGRSGVVWPNGDLIVNSRFRRGYSGISFPSHDLSGQSHGGAGGCKGGRQSVTGPMGATNLADGAHGPHVALVSRAEFR